MRILKRLQRLWELSKELGDAPNEWPTEEELDKSIERLVSDNPDVPKRPSRMATIVELDVKDPFPPEEELEQNDKTS